MWTTRAPVPLGRHRGRERGLAGAGRPVDADQPAVAERRRPRRQERQHDRRGVLRAASGSEGEAMAAVRRHGVHEPRPRRAGARRWCARTARRTSRAGTTPGRRSRASRPGARSAASAPRRRPRARSGAARAAPTATGSRSSPAGPEATSPPPCTVATCGEGRRTTGQPEVRRRAGLEGLVVVEQRRHQQPGPGRDLGHHRVGGRGLDRAGAAGVPELQLGDLGQRRGDLGAPGAPAGSPTRLQPPHDQRPGPLAGHLVGHAGDLALVGHHADEPEAARSVDRAGQLAPRRRRRTAASAWGRRAGRPPAARRRCRGRPGPGPPARRARSPRGRGARRRRPSA